MSTNQEIIYKIRENLMNGKNGVGATYWVEDKKKMMLKCPDFCMRVKELYDLHAAYAIGHWYNVVLFYDNAFKQTHNQKKSFFFLPLNEKYAFEILFRIPALFSSLSAPSES